MSTPDLHRRELVAAPGWARGLARVDGEDVVLDMDGAERYSAAEFSGLEFALAAIREPHEILGFVRRYGMLWHGPENTGECREPVSHWLQEAIAFELAMDLAVAIQDAVDGDVEAKAQLRSNWLVIPWRLDFPPGSFDSDEILKIASIVLARTIERGLGDTVRQRFVAASEVGHGGPGTYMWLSQVETLLGYAYHELASAIDERIPIASCEECGRRFAVQHGRQRFCSPRCASRARYKRFAAKRKSQEELGE